MSRRKLGEGLRVALGAGGRTGGGSCKKLFAHIGLKAIDDFAGERHGQAYVDYKAHAVSLPDGKESAALCCDCEIGRGNLTCAARNRSYQKVVHNS